LDRSGKLALVHNGVIENHKELKDRLVAKGHKFISQTDTEVLAHLIGEYYELLGHSGIPAEPPRALPHERLYEAVRHALKEVIGTYGIALLHLNHPGIIVGARRGSPLLVGVGQNENFLASDVNAIVAHTRRVVYLNDFEIVTLTADSFEVTHLESGRVSPEVLEIQVKAKDVDRGRYPHFMLKEIFEQPQTVQNALRGRLAFDEATTRFGGLNCSPAELRAVDRIIFLGCGSALHAGMVGKYLMEDLARIPTECDCASEFRYRNSPVEKNTLVFAISQSGETIDTLAAVRECRRKGHKTLGIVNVVGSTIAREVDGGIYMHAGPEIGVAATKSFTSQLTVLTILVVLMGR
ncbi:MAG: isomerizing glutamine--fructose-6-phosphate transaminase, partial [Verrucomicrobiae bacterium]|nr:isomerizing glutamine--fructose-6-phosphate transaminase [Verrucomicrobiae bacterium]